MFTFQDLEAVGNEETERIKFILDVIEDHRQSDLYKTAVIGDDYDRGLNTTIKAYENFFVSEDGTKKPDDISPNHKMASSFFNRFTTQLNQFLLGNGITWHGEAIEVPEGTPGAKRHQDIQFGENGDVIGVKTYWTVERPSRAKEILGEDFDTRAQDLGKAALVGKVAFGFFNKDHLEILKLGGRPDEACFVPLIDEETAEIKAGVKYWQIADNKPLRATLFETDGYTEYRYFDEKGKKQGEVMKPKTPYIVETSVSDVGGVRVSGGRNYKKLPIIPMWSNPEKQAEIIRIRDAIDAYDLIKNGYANDLDVAQIYWIIRGANAAEDIDIARFLDRLKTNKIANVPDDRDVQMQTVDLPYAAREQLLDRISADLYRDFCALDVDNIRSGAVTATQIEAAYEPLNSKADQYEYCVLEFLKQLLNLLGIEGEYATFTRSKMINVNEDVQTVLSAAAQIGNDDYTTRKILTLLGDGDRADDIIDAKAADEINQLRNENAEN